MENLRWVAIGFIVVVADLRIDGVDVITDGVGWAVALIAFLPLRALHPGFSVAAVAAGLGLVAWAAHPWLGVDQGPADLAEVVAQTGLVFATCTALMTLVPEKRSSADLIRWADLGIGVVALLGVLALRQGDGDGLVLLVVPLVVLALVVCVSFLVLLFRCARIAPARASAGQAGTPSG